MLAPRKTDISSPVIPKCRHLMQSMKSFALIFMACPEENQWPSSEQGVESSKQAAQGLNATSETPQLRKKLRSLKAFRRPGFAPRGSCQESTFRLHQGAPTQQVPLRPAYALTHISGLLSHKAISSTFPPFTVPLKNDSSLASRAPPKPL